MTKRDGEDDGEGPKELMELVTKKRLVLVAGRGHEELSAEVAAAPEGPARRRRAVDVRERRDLLPLRREHPRRGRVRVPVALRTDQRPLDGTADHDRRGRSARRRSASPRCARSTATRVRTGRPKAREPITARLVADLISAAGADRVVTVDLHTGQIQGFFDYPVDHLTAVPVLEEYLREDARRRGRVRRARRRRRQAGSPLRRPVRRRHRVHRQAAAEGHAQRRGRDRGRRRDRGPHVRDRRRHDRHRGHRRQRGQPPHRPGCDRGLHRRHPRSAVGPRRRPAQERADPGGRSSPTRCRSRPRSASTACKVLSIAPLLADAIDAVFEEGSVSELFDGDNV